MLYIYLNYTGNVSSYLIENRSLLNYKENSKLMQKKKMHVLLRMVRTLIKYALYEDNAEFSNVISGG